MPNTNTTKGSKSAIPRYLDKLLIWMWLSLICGTSICHGKAIKATLVTEKRVSSTLAEEAKRESPTGANVEHQHIVSVRGENTRFYVVPVFINGNEKSGCFLYQFDKNLRLVRKLLLSELQEAESCETVTAIFSCNRAGASSPLGIGILYGKRLGFDHYWFEGAYFTVDPAGNLASDQPGSELLTDVDTAARAKKKLHCR